MATITTDTFLDGGTARTAGEAWTCNGGKLTVRTDTRWHANAPASMTGSLGSITVSSSLGGGVEFNATSVRWLPYNTGSGNVPAIGTSVSQGAVSGYLLGVWANLTSAPTAVGAAMPASGFIKFREVSGGTFAAGALTGIGASATGPDVTGWIEVVMDQAATITVPRKGSGSVTRGDWFYLDDTDGNIGQVIQTPTNGGGTGTRCPGMWVETGVGTDSFEYWPALNGATNGWAVQHLGTPVGISDVRQQFVKDIGSGQMQIGESFTSAALTYTITSSAATYTWAADEAVITFTAHGLSVGREVSLTFTTGGATANSGTFFVKRVTSANAFVVDMAGSGASGNVTLRANAVISYANHPFSVGNFIDVTVTTGDWPGGPSEVISVVTGASGSITVAAPFVTGGTGGNCTVTMTIGKVPPAGCRVRIPNVILRQCTTGARATNQVPNGTLGTRPDFTTTGAGVVDHEYTYGDWYYITSQAYQTRMVHVATFDAINISECATDVVLEDGGCGMYGALDVVTLTLTSNFAGGTITDWSSERGNAPGTSDHATAISTCLGLNFVRGRHGIIQFGRSSGVAISVSQSSNMSFTDVHVINQGVALSTATGMTLTNLDYSDRYVGYTGTSALSAITCTAKAADVIIDGMTFGFNNQAIRLHPYTSILSVTACDRILMKNIGTRLQPITPVDQGVNVMNSIWSSGGNNADITVKRCYVGMVRSGPSTTVNSDKNVLEESVHAILLNTGLASTFTPSALNQKHRGGGAGANSVAANASVYGTHIYDIFASATEGRVVLVLNEPTEDTTGQVTYVSGTPQFTSVPSLSMPTSGDQVIIEMDYFALGHTAFRNQAPTLTGTNTGNMSYEYQIDLGSGYNGTWLTLNGTNLSSHTIDPAVGFKMKFRITCTVASTTNAITHVRITTDTDEASQADNLYPISTNAVTLTGLKNPTEVRIFNSGTTTEIGGQESVTSGTFTTEIDAGSYPLIDISILSLGYQNTRLTGVNISGGDISIPVQQQIDRQYANI